MQADRARDGGVQEQPRLQAGSDQGAYERTLLSRAAESYPDASFFLPSLQAEIKQKKADVSKHTAGVKTLQREVQTAELELGTYLLARANRSWA